MTVTTTLTDIERLYSEVLDLTHAQTRCLSCGEVATLPELLDRKVATLAKAQELTTGIQRSGVDLTTPACQQKLAHIAELLRGIMESEEICESLVPKAPRVSNRATAVAAYGQAGRSK